MAETPSIYKRFAQSDKISQGTTNAALSLNDYLPGQHVTGPNNNDIAATLAQVQAIPIGTATLSGNTYNVTISNYPNTATIYPGQKISVKFNADAPTADDTALNLSAFGQSLPLCARGVRMGKGAIKSGMILELVYRGDMWNADYDVVKANRDANGYTTFADGQSGYSVSQIDNALMVLSEINVPSKDTYAECMPTALHKTSVCGIDYNKDETNRPKNGYNYIITSTRFNASQGVQIAQGASADSNFRPVCYIRFMDNNVFVDWQKLTTETDLNSALANCSFTVSGNKLIIQNSSYKWEFTGSAK